VITNVPAAVSKLNTFLQCINRHDQIVDGPLGTLDPAYSIAYEAVMTLMPIIESIARATEPGVEHDLCRGVFAVWQRA
jgi:hypothetical protein